MSRTIAAMALAAAFALAGPAQASPLDGLWRSPDENALVQIYDCGSAVCGKLVEADKIKANPHVTDDRDRTPALRARPLKGLVLLNGFAGGPAEWKDGSIYNPNDGDTYQGSMRLVDPDTLKVTGCIIVPLCKTEVWKRVR